MEVTRRYIGECERASAPPPPARSLGNDRRAEETRHRRFLREPVAAERASAARSGNPEFVWLGPNRCAVFVCGQMGRLIGPNGTCVIDTVKETGCEISKLDDERVVVEGATQTLVERGVERVRDEVSKWLRAGAEDTRGKELSATKALVPATKHPIVPWRPNPAREAAREGLLVTKIGGAPTPAFAERPRSADAPSAPVSAESRQKSARAGADALSAERELSETGEIVQEPRVIGSPRSATNALPATNTARDEAADDADAEPETEIGAEPGYDAVADFSDCLPPGRTRPGGRRSPSALSGTLSRNPSRTPLPANPITYPRRATRSPRPRPRPRPGAGGARRGRGGRRPRRPKPRVPSTSAPLASGSCRSWRRGRSRATRSFGASRTRWTRPARRNQTPHCGCRRRRRCVSSRETCSSGTGYRRRAASRYRVSLVLSATPDASAREKTRAKPEGWTLARDWALALDETDEGGEGNEGDETSPAMPTRGAEEGAPADRRAAPRAPTVVGDEETESVCVRYLQRGVRAKRGGRVGGPAVRRGLREGRRVDPGDGRVRDRAEAPGAGADGASL